MRIANIVFREINSINAPLYRDTTIALIVSDDYRVVERARYYRERGINAVIYPLSIVDSPTLLSLLGVSAWLYEKNLEGLVVVEGYGQQRLLEKAYQVIFLGMDVDKAMLQDLVSPLHIRSIIQLHSLRTGSIDIVNEARSLIDSAFTGGDAHKSTVLELGIDLIIQLDAVSHIPLSCVSHLYNTVIYGKTYKTNEICSHIYKVSELLDYSNNGAVKNLALVRKDSNEINIIIGCKLFLSNEECWPEITTAKKALAKLLNELGFTLGDIIMARPEEAACIAYNTYANEVCKE